MLQPTTQYSAALLRRGHSLNLTGGGLSGGGLSRMMRHSLAACRRKPSASTLCECSLAPKAHAAAHEMTGEVQNVDASESTSLGRQPNARCSPNENCQLGVSGSRRGLLPLPLLALVWVLEAFCLRGNSFVCFSLVWCLCPPMLTERRPGPPPGGGST
jgi:hypothetical protein